MTHMQAFANQPITIISLFLVIIGALNWLSIGLTSTDLVQPVFQSYSNIIYIIVGFAGLYLAIRKIMWIAHKS